MPLCSRCERIWVPKRAVTEHGDYVCLRCKSDPWCWDCPAKSVPPFQTGHICKDGCVHRRPPLTLWAALSGGD